MTVFDDARGLLATAHAATSDVLDHAQANSATLGERYITDAADAVLAVSSAQAMLTTLEPRPLMPLLSGLFAEGMSTPSTDVHNYVCNVKWSELQATPLGPLLHPNPIDKAIASGKTFHVRPYFGRYSPSFATALVGSVLMSDTQDGITARVPCWWRSDVQALQADVVAKLAATYDGKISLIFVSTPMAIYAEPMIRQIGDTATRTALRAAGLTFDLDQAAFAAALDWYSAFRQTRLGIAVNPWQAVKADGTAWSSSTATNIFIDQYRTRFPGAHIQNNSARTPPLPSYAGMYSHMAGLKPLGFQTATEPRVGSYATTVQWAIDQGAHLVELSPGYEKHLTSTQLRGFDSALKANVA